MKFLDHSELIPRVGKRSKVKTWRDVKADRFPPPVYDGERQRWVDIEIDSYQRWRLAVRDGDTTIERWSEWWALDRQRAGEAA
jgi:predicted DNA-binding transcriptional regulator AlpA